MSEWLRKFINDDARDSINRPEKVDPGASYEGRKEAFCVLCGRMVNLSEGDTDLVCNLCYDRRMDD